ncbi:MAG: sugar phosphate isomerase/epimerase family protein [Nanoarchaeota archaeon]
MKLSGSYWGTNSGSNVNAVKDLQQMIPKLAEHFKFVRLSNWIIGIREKESADRLIELKEKHGVGYNIHMDYSEMNLAAKSDRIREASIGDAKEAVDFMALLGGGVLNFHLAFPPIFYRPGMDEMRLMHWNLELDSFRQIVACAKGKKVIIAIENVPPIHNFPHYIESCNFKHHIFMLDNIKDDHFGINFDIGHFNITAHKEKIDLKDVMKDIGPRIKYVHVHDNDGSSDQHRPIGQGNIDWELFLDLLNQYGYEGVLEFEIGSLDDQIASKEYLMRLRPGYF